MKAKKVDLFLSGFGEPEKYQAYPNPTHMHPRLERKLTETVDLRKCSMIRFRRCFYVPCTDWQRRALRVFPAAQSACSSPTPAGRHLREVPTHRACDFVGTFCLPVVLQLSRLCVLAFFTDADGINQPIKTRIKDSM